MIRLFESPVRGHERPYSSATLLEDLELAELLGAYFEDPVAHLTRDTAAILRRNECIRDLIARPALFEALEILHDRLAELAGMGRAQDADPMLLFSGMTIFKALHAAIERACNEIRACDKLSAQFYGLCAALEAFARERYPQQFSHQWQRYADGVDLARSLVYRMTFNERLTIDRIALSGVYRQRFARGTPSKRGADDQVPGKSRDVVSLMKDDRSMSTLLSSMLSWGYDPAHDLPALRRVRSALNQLLAVQVVSARRQVRAAAVRMLESLGDLLYELKYLIGAVNFTKSLSESGLPVCFASAEPPGSRTLRAQGIYHPVLAQSLGDRVTLNSVSLAGSSEIILLGGANRGGKTTFLRAAGAVQVLFQMGLPVPATNASLCIAGTIACAFARQESTELAHGKLGQELTDAKAALEALDECGLFLFNEPITATSPLESYLLSREVLCMLKAKRSRGVFVTHLYELFDDVENINGAIPGSVVSCMNAGHEGDGREPFSIQPGKPDGGSGAARVMELACDQSRKTENFV